MSKVICRYCYFDTFNYLSKDTIQCNKCRHLITNTEDLIEVDSNFKEMSKDQILAEALLYQIRIVGRINVIKKNIDQALDQGDEKTFLDLSSELKQLEMLLEAEKEGSIKS